MSRRLKIILGSLAAVIVVLGVFWYGLGYGWWGWYERAGDIEGSAVPVEIVQSRSNDATRAAVAAGVAAPKQILFGDWHVHTTFSGDAFNMSLPQAQGEGATPPADACDFARFCSGIDFWALTDHVEQYTPRHWKESIESVRQCNAITDPQNPDVVAFLGWEWTQVGMDDKSHYGHKNVVLKGIEDDEITARPISAGGIGLDPNVVFPNANGVRMSFLFSGLNPQYLRFSKMVTENRAIVDCDATLHTKDLPANCRESAETPEVLFRKLDESGVESIVIPHGTSWGYYTPLGSDWRKQLTPQMQDPKRQSLVEIFSGHGNAEEYRSWRDVAVDEQGNRTCPEPSANYLPGCWRAGEIIEARCLKAELGADECVKRAAEARQNYVNTVGLGSYLTVPGTKPADWEDAGQCRDCFMPPFTHRPLSSVQYMMAIRNFDEMVDGKPMRFDFGFIGSSDNHTARPGTGYKEYDRLEMTEVAGRPKGFMAQLRLPKAEEPLPQSRPITFGQTGIPIMAFTEQERNASYFATGALMAVHAQGRTRDNIWDAVERKEVYATSGPRMLLWFDMVDDKGMSLHPMGAHIKSAATPRFKVTAVGAYKQKAGCPDYSKDALSADRLKKLCRGECYNPTDQRALITRIEVIRILPQNAKNESVDGLISDPWKTFTCKPNPAGCSVTFDDPEFVGSKRDAVYYVRAIQEPSDAINGDGIKCLKRDAAGRCTELKSCGFDKSPDDDCLGRVEERAWSSPILVDAAG